MGIFVQAALFHQHFDLSNDDGERRTEFMRDVREEAQFVRVEFLLPLRLLLLETDGFLQTHAVFPRMENDPGQCCRDENVEDHGRIRLVERRHDGDVQPAFCRFET